MKVGCLLSVREKATRLPKKVLLDVAGEPLTKRLLQRLSMADDVDEVILSTSIHPNDKVLVELAESAGYLAFEGSEDDKLKRYYDTALQYGLDAVVIVDGDDPFCFPEWVGLIVKELRRGNSDCVYIEGLPLGAASTGLMTSALKRVLEIKDESDTEVWGGYFIGSGHFAAKKISVLDPLFNHPHIRLTLDYEDDYQFVTAIINEFDGRTDFTSRELMDLLVNRKPELCSINKGAQTMYESHLAEAAPVRFRSI